MICDGRVAVCQGKSRSRIGSKNQKAFQIVAHATGLRRILIVNMGTFSAEDRCVEMRVQVSKTQFGPLALVLK